MRVGAITLVMALAVQLADGGYEYGFGEQTLLSIKGISWADPTAFVGDWFNERAPQPHVLFDVITYLSEEMGIRPGVYFAYWVASLVVAACAIVVLSDHWLPRRLRPFELLVGLLIAIGPFFALGTFLLVHREAVPNGLGGALGFLTAAFLVTHREKAAVVAALLTTAVHVQHGSVAAVILLVAWVLDRDRLRRPVVRWFPVVAAVILATVYTIARVRGLVAGSADVPAICKTASPGQCYPQSWSWPVIRDGVGVVLLGTLAPWLTGRRPSLRAICILAFPALIATTALVTDLANIQPFASLGRELFLYRFVMVVAPFAPWAIVLALTRPLTRGLRLDSVLLALAGMAALVWWLGAAFPTLLRFRPKLQSEHLAGLLVGSAIVVIVVGWTMVRARPPFAGLSSGPDLMVTWLVVVASVGSLLWYSGRAVGYVPLQINYSSQDAVLLGRAIERSTPPGSVLAVRPDVDWIRLWSRRAVLIDCKGVPYGGKPWREYNERLAAVGVSSPLKCSNAGFAALTPQEIEGLRDRFGATHVLLDVNDTARAKVDGVWTKVYDSGPPAQTSIYEIPAAASR